MSYYKKKPIPVLCHRWHRNGDHPDDFSDRDNSEGIMRREGMVVRRFVPTVTNWSCGHCGETAEVHGWIFTMEGGHIVCPGDWIITGIKGERYPCKPDIFAESYEPADTRHAAPVVISEEMVNKVIQTFFEHVEIEEGVPVACPMDPIRSALAALAHVKEGGETGGGWRGKWVSMEARMPPACINVLTFRDDPKWPVVTWHDSEGRWWHNGGQIKAPFYWTDLPKFDRAEGTEP